MDSISIAVFDKISSLAAFGKFVVFSEDELFDAFPDGEAKSEAALNGVLKSLKDDGFIDLKYSSGNLYCIAPLKKSVPVQEPVTEEVVSVEKVPKPQHIRGAIFFLAFLGGALGSLIISLIFRLL
ncbi:MAG: hypothetical protein K2O89_01780 [Clostridia bacterium]|nr:hypothetical protein [Clostridia bacterium]